MQAMFLFNKNNPPPRSRRSSVDSLVVDPSVSTPNSEACVSQCSDATSYGESPSPDQRERLYHPGKRNSVFNLRSRSNTATSTTPSFVSSQIGTMGSDTFSNRSSQDLRHLAGQSFMELPGGKKLFHRGKKLRRQSGQVYPGHSIETIEDVDTSSKRASVLRKSRWGNMSESTVHPLRHRISSPFDFQHLTHTDRHQFAALEQASENDLVAEFWASRASQVPRRDLKGIKADDLHFQNFSSENLATAEPSRPASAKSNRSPTYCQEPLDQSESSLQEHGKSVRLSRSVESFSQPRARTHRHTQSAVPPPRISSRQALTRIDDLPEESAATVRAPPPPPLRSKRSSGVWSSLSPLSPPATGNPLPTIVDEPNTVGHAVTTPDDNAILATTPPFSPDLENVPEEPERFSNPRTAPPPPVRPSKPKSPSFESFTFRTSQRSPISRTNSRGSLLTSPKSGNMRSPMTRPMSQMSDTLGSPILSRKNSVRRSPTVRRKSNTWRVIEESWEDDIDYIYDNALEAECEFDWDRRSDHAVFEDRDRTPEQQSHMRPSTAVSQDTQTGAVKSEDDTFVQEQIFRNPFRPSLLVPSAISVPELESRSAISASTADTGVQTPSDNFNTTSSLVNGPSPFTEIDGFSFTPSALIPQDFKEQLSREEMYDNILADYEGSDRHFPLMDASQSVSSSSRSSRVRSSKRSSCDSSLMSSIQGSGVWSSPVRRSASSSGSLPELVHSRRTRKNLDLMVDQLSEQVASCSSFGDDDNQECEDNETTPPGRPTQDRTFFAEDEDNTYEIEHEVKASLELARQGSTRSTNKPHLHFHKYASSDSAAKMLSAPAEQPLEPQQQPRVARNRASSSSKVIKGNRQPYLSLFPAPPKRSPIPSLGSPFDPSSNN